MSMRGFTLLTLVAAALVVGCGDDSQQSSTNVFGTEARERVRAVPAGQEPVPSVEPRRPPPPVMPIDDQTFVEGAHARDPFRPGEHPVVCGGRPGGVLWPEVQASRYPLDALRLQAVARSSEGLYAMVVDPSGVGTIVRPGMYVGQPEILTSNGSYAGPFEVVWRVARITPARFSTRADGVLEETPAQVVFERPDPFNPSAQVTERALSVTTDGVR